MIDLLTYPPLYGQFSASPFCTKAACLLTLSGQPWQREDTLDPRKLPHGKLPVIRVAGRIIPDSDGIRDYLEANGANFDKGLSKLGKATSRAFIRMAEDHMYFHLLFDRWGNEAIWPSIRDTYFKPIPFVLRGFISGRVRKEVLHGLHAQGIGRFSEADRLARIEADLAAIATRLGQDLYLFGDEPSAADCSVGPMLSAMIATPVETALSRRVAEDAILAAYAARVAELTG